MGGRDNRADSGGSYCGDSGMKRRADQAPGGEGYSAVMTGNGRAERLRLLRHRQEAVVAVYAGPGDAGLSIITDNSSFAPITERQLNS